ncbi:DUF5989 family protein [Bacteriovoracaceae bacterium]|nr:DUF5989 family protein [Bacteriovoracaceae bacterium]|tara:strand:- start:104104 stop:104268 length:165 start_codon:yes stop_codon:yes gene_type:complete
MKKLIITYRKLIQNMKEQKLYFFIPFISTLIIFAVLFATVKFISPLAPFVYSLF